MIACVPRRDRHNCANEFQMLQQLRRTVFPARIMNGAIDIFGQECVCCTRTLRLSSPRTSLELPMTGTRSELEETSGGAFDGSSRGVRRDEWRRVLVQHTQSMTKMSAFLVIEIVDLPSKSMRLGTIASETGKQPPLV